MEVYITYTRVTKHSNPIHLAVGSNLQYDNKTSLAIVRMVYDILNEHEINVIAKSSFWHSSAYPNKLDPPFINSVVEVSTKKEPLELLIILKEIETFLGRKTTSRWSSRTCDIDIISIGQETIPNLRTALLWMNNEEAKKGISTPDQLIIPHPRMHERSFVLGPLNEISQTWMHPVLQKTSKELWESLSDHDKIESYPLS